MRVFVLVGSNWKVDLLVEAIPMIKLFMLWNRVFNLYTQGYTGLIGPTSRYILDCIAPASHHNGWESIPKHVFQAFSMSFDAKVKMPQLVM